MATDGRLTFVPAIIGRDAGPRAADAAPKDQSHQLLGILALHHAVFACPSRLSH